MIRKIVVFASLFFVALASGGAFAVYLLYNPAAVGPASWIGMLQHSMHVLIPLAVALNLGLLFTIVSAILARRERVGLYLLIAASLCLVAAVLITVVGNWPINDQIGTWSLTAPPSNWTDVSREWWHLHVARTGVVIGALTLVILAMLRRDATQSA